MQAKRFLLSEFELLRATNHISKTWGGSRLGNIGQVGVYHDEDGRLRPDTCGTYLRQFLISVELQDDNAYPLPGEETVGKAWRIRMGFCQTNITRAPSGGFTLEIGPMALSLCGTVEHVVGLVECMLGNAPERENKLERWLDQVIRWREERTAIALDITALIREDVLAHQMEEALID